MLSSLLIAALAALIAVPVSARDIPAQSEAFYVNDLAGVLSDETKQHIVSVNDELYAKTGAQIVAVTMGTLDGDSLEEFSTELFRKYGIGSSEKNNGVLLLLVTGDRLSRIEVGYGLEGALPDGKTGRIQDDYMIPYYADNLWDEGIRSGFDAIVAEVAAEYDTDVKSTAPTVYEKTYPAWYEDGDMVTCLLMLVSVPVGIVCAKLFGKGGLLPILGWIVWTCVFISRRFGGGYAFGSVMGNAVASFIGWVIGMPDIGGSSGSHGGSHHTHYSSFGGGHSSGGSFRTGGGGWSGGGGSSRKF